MFNYIFLTLFISIELFTSAEYQTKFNWNLINNKHWQPVNLPYDDGKIIENQGECPDGMVEVDGLMKQDPNRGLFSGQNIDALQKRACKRWLNIEPAWGDRCKEYDKEKWLAMSANYKKSHMRFCIDRFEAGVNKFEYPPVMITYTEAEQICKYNNKRLCTEDEWTFACEGPEAIPYPYGYIRDETACVIDKKWILYSKDLFPRATIKSLKEMDKLWQGEPAGSRPRCKSIFGVYDLTGNVDEITMSTRPDGKYKLALKGGYWAGVRNRCRATTRSHDERFSFYQVSFRCCKNL